MRRWHQRTLTAAVAAALLTVVAVPDDGGGGQLPVRAQPVRGRLHDGLECGRYGGRRQGPDRRNGASGHEGRHPDLRGRGGHPLRVQRRGIGLVHTRCTVGCAVPLLLVLLRWTRRRNRFRSTAGGTHEPQSSPSRGGAIAVVVAIAGGSVIWGAAGAAVARDAALSHRPGAGGDQSKGGSSSSELPRRAARNRRHRSLDIAAPRCAGRHPVLDRAGPVVERLRARAVGEPIRRDGRIVLSGR